MKRFFASSILIASLVAVSSADLLYYVEDNSNELRTVDTSTLSSSTVGVLGTTGEFGDLAYDRRAGVMYFIGGFDDNNLYTVNLTTGAATLVGNHQIHNLFALGWDPNTGGLFASDTDGQTWSLDKLTAGATYLGDNNVYPGGMTYHSGLGEMLLSSAGGFSISSVNLSDGTSTLLGGSGSMNDNDIVYSTVSGDLFAMDWSGNLFSIDGSYNHTVLGGGYGKVASVEAVPEPATMTLLGLGALVALRKRKA